MTKRNSPGSLPEAVILSLSVRNCSEIIDTDSAYVLDYYNSEIPDCRPWSLFAYELTFFVTFIVFISSLSESSEKRRKKEGACFQKFMKILENKRLLAAFTIELMK
jgi:hypothetical protein